MVYEYECKECGKITCESRIVDERDYDLYCDCGALCKRLTVPSRVVISVPEAFHTSKSDVLPSDSDPQFVHDDWKKNCVLKKG